MNIMAAMMFPLTEVLPKYVDNAIIDCSQNDKAIKAIELAMLCLYPEVEQRVSDCTS